MRCYFNLVNSHQSITDDKGIEVADVDEARSLAREAAAEMIQAGEAQIEDWRGWKMEAVDASGAALFTISLDAVLS